MIEILQKQEALLQFSKFTNADALHIGNAIAEHAKNQGKAVAIEIVVNGWTLFLHCMDGTSPENIRWMRRKRNFLEYRRTSSLLGQKLMESKNKTMQSIFLDEADYSDRGGAFPIRIGEQIVGSIIVSGLPDVEDHQMVVDVLTTCLGREVLSIL